MAGFGDCIRSAQKQGVLSDDEADALIQRYEEHRSANAEARDPEGAAKAGLTAEMEAAAARKQLLAGITAEKVGAIKQYLTEFRDLSGKANVFEAAINLIENFGAGAGTSSIAGRSKAIVSLAHGQMADLLSTFRRSRITGQRFNKPLMDDVVREMLGESTGKPEAKAMADTVSKTFETLREDFNKAGGDIGKLDYGYIPQFHDPRALLAAGYTKWRNDILPRLSLDKMKDPMTGGKLTPERLESGLKASFDSATTGGWDKREPSMQPFGQGSVANQRGEHRFLHFKTANDWLSYDRDYGHGDPVKAIFNHVNGMARDISAMEVLGPNPGATKEWLKQVVTSEAAKAGTGAESLFKGLGANLPEAAGKYAGWRIDALYNYVRGRETISGKVATTFADVRNVLTSAQLGSASILAAATDPFIDSLARYMSGLPITKALYGIASAIKATHTREQAVRSGMILDDFLHIAGDEARYAGTLGGGEWSKWLAERTVNLNGLEPITQARRHVFGLDFQAMVADNAQLSFSELADGSRKNRYFLRAMESYGIKEKDWDKLRATDPFAPEGAGFIRPSDVKNRDIAKKYLEMILGETERAVPTGTARSKSFVVGRNPRGTIQSELLESGLQYKSFALSFTTLQLQALRQEWNVGPVQATAYAASMVGLLSLGGALSMQIKNIVNGKDLQPMDPSTGQGFKFWLQSLQTGGGFGVAGDLLFSDQTRFGGGFGDYLMGPTISAATDIGKVTVGNIQKAITGKKTNAARDAIRVGGKYVPIVSTLPYTKAAFQRILLDQMMYAADPEAHKYFHNQEQTLRRETSQGYFWRPGETSPSRMPEAPAARR